MIMIIYTDVYMILILYEHDGYVFDFFLWTVQDYIYNDCINMNGVLPTSRKIEYTHPNINPSVCDTKMYQRQLVLWLGVVYSIFLDFVPVPPPHYNRNIWHHIAIPPAIIAVTEIRTHAEFHFKYDSH